MRHRALTLLTLATLTAPSLAQEAVPPPPAPHVARAPGSSFQAEAARRRARKRAHEAQMARAAAERREQGRRQADYERRMAPVVAEQQRAMADLAIRQQQADAMSRMAAAAEAGLQIERARYIMQSQQAGVPQVAAPGGGQVPYAYGVARPLR